MSVYLGFQSYPVDGEGTAVRDEPPPSTANSVPTMIWTDMNRIINLLHTQRSCRYVVLVRVLTSTRIHFFGFLLPVSYPYFLFFKAFCFL